MKKNYALSILFLLLTSFVYSQSIISLTFTAELNGGHQPVDSIYIENFTQGGDTALYGNDTVLVLDDGIGIDNWIVDGLDRLILYPNYPNPFTQSTTVSFYLPNAEPVTINVFDLPGREVITYCQTLQSGTHLFEFLPGQEAFYLLTVETKDQRQVQKLINLGHSSGKCRIEYFGYQGHSKVMRKGKSGFPFALGDSLSFTGYARNAVRLINAKPMQSETFVFQYSKIGCPETVTDIDGNIYKAI